MCPVEVYIDNQNCGAIGEPGGKLTGLPHEVSVDYSGDEHGKVTVMMPGHKSVTEELHPRENLVINYRKTGKSFSTVTDVKIVRT